MLLTWKNAFYYNKHTAFPTRKIFIALNIIKTSFHEFEFKMCFVRKKAIIKYFRYSCIKK